MPTACLEDAGLWDHYIEARHREPRAAHEARRERAGISRDRRPAEQAHARGYPATSGRMGQKELEAFTPHPDKDLRRQHAVRRLRSVER
jgi:hypothetical protein